MNLRPSRMTTTTFSERCVSLGRCTAWQCHLSLTVDTIHERTRCSEWDQSVHLVFPPCCFSSRSAQENLLSVRYVSCRVDSLCVGATPFKLKLEHQQANSGTFHRGTLCSQSDNNGYMISIAYESIPCRPRYPCRLSLQS